MTPPKDNQPRLALVNITSMKGHHGCALVNRRIDELATAAGMTIVDKIPLFHNFQKVDTSRFDLILVNGEGTLHHDTPGAHRIGETAKWAKSIGKPAILINSICESVPPEVGQRLRDYTDIFVRDRLSQRELERLGMEARWVPDLTLSWRPEPRRTPQPNTIFVTDSTMRGINQELHQLAGRLSNTRFLPLIARPPTLTSLANHNLPARAAFATKRALAGIVPMGLWRDRYRCAIPDFANFTSTLLDHARLIVAGRFHAVCLALDLEIPFVAIGSNSWKVQSLLSEIGLENRLLDRTSLSTLNDSSRLNNGALDYTQEEIDAIRTYRQDAFTKANGMFERIARLVRDTTTSIDSSHPTT